MITRLTDISPAKGNILFIHGMCHGAWCWDQGFIQRFNEAGYNGYAIDLTKHDAAGKTLGINKVTINNYLDDVKLAIKEIGGDVILVGHSMGGFIIQKYLESNTAAKAILLASVPPSGILPAALRYLSKFPEALPSFILQDIYAPFVKNAATLYHPDTDQELIRKCKEKMCSESFKVLLQMMFGPVKKMSSTPILVLGAKEDRVINEKEVISTAQFHQVEAHVMGDLGHNMMLDTEYDKVADIVLKWL